MMRADKLAAAGYWFRRAEETHAMADRFRQEAEQFEQFGRAAMDEAGQPTKETPCIAAPDA